MAVKKRGKIVRFKRVGDRPGENVVAGRVEGCVIEDATGRKLQFFRNLGHKVTRVEAAGACCVELSDAGLARLIEALGRVLRAR